MVNSSLSELCGFCGQTNDDGTDQCVACGAPLVTHLHVLPKGTTLRNGRYLVGRVLGEGGFGITYQGTDLNLGRAIALKEFFPQGSTRSGTQMIPAPSIKSDVLQTMLGEFMTEAQMLSRFDHPHIVPVFDIFEENFTAYLVMQYLRGQPLEHVVSEHGPLSEASVILYLQQVGSALEQIHASGLLHRDIKPGNIILTTDDRAVLIDFGSARNFTEGTTQKQTQILTSGYAPPEQYALQARRGGFTDIYALAGTAYYLLTGKIPIGAMDRLYGQDLPDIALLCPGLNPRIKEALLKGLALRIEDRPATISQFLTLLVPGTVVPIPEPEPLPLTRLLTSRVWLRPGVAKTLRGTPGIITSLAFQPGGELLASAAADGFFVWNIATKQKIHSLASDGSERLLVGFSPDGQGLYGASTQGRFTLWDLASGQIYHALSKLARNCAAMSFSPDGVFLALGSENEYSRISAKFTIEIVALNDGSPYWTFRGHRGAVSSLAYSKDGQYLISGSRDGMLCQWQIGQEQPLVTLNAGKGVTSVALHPDGQRCAAGREDGVVQLWHLTEQRLIAQTQQPLGPVAALNFHPAGYLLVGGCNTLTTEDGSSQNTWGSGLHFWDVITARQRLTSLASPLRQGTTAVIFSADGQYLAGATTDGQIHLLTNQGS